MSPHFFSKKRNRFDVEWNYATCSVSTIWISSKIHGKKFPEGFIHGTLRGMKDVTPPGKNGDNRRDRSVPPTDPIERFGWWLDEAFLIPGTRIRFGWDAIIGLVPGLGESIMVALQAALVFYLVVHREVPAVIAARMVVNVFIDALVGAIPLVGDVFDIFFKANTRNIDLVREVRYQRATTGRVKTLRHYAFLGVLALALMSIVGGALFLVFHVLRYLVDALTSLNGAPLW